jgi:hypothetical protein
MRRAVWKRRDFLKQSAACVAAGATLSFGATPARAARPFAHQPFDAVIVAARYGDSRLFAAALRQQGARVLDTAVDLGRLWHGALGSQFAQRPQRLAGLTPHSDLLVCESFAREQGACLIYTGAHDCRGGEYVTHSLKVGDSLAGLAANLEQAGARWPARLARQLGLASPRHRPRHQEAVATRTSRAADHPGTLYSWVLA